MSTRQGFQSGGPMGDWGNIRFTRDVAAKIAESGAAWVRLNFRLGPHARDWTENETLGFSVLSRYDEIVENARRESLKILGLLCNEAWQCITTQDEWRNNSAEVGRGNGDNAYIQGFASGAAGLLFGHFSDSISNWQIWNEPNSTLTYLYPSNFAWLLRRCYITARESGVPGITIVSGGLLSTHSMTSKTLTSANTGADYLRAIYRQGKAQAGWEDIRRTHGSYPLDVVGQHLYIDQWSKTSPARIEQAVSFMHNSAVSAEGDAAGKPIYVTEMGWTTDNVSERTQADNLKTAYVKLKSIRFTPVTYWFFLRDEPLAKLGHGLLRDDGSEKPAWAAFREINELQVYPKPQAAPATTWTKLRQALGMS